MVVLCKLEISILSNAQVYYPIPTASMHRLFFFCLLITISESPRIPVNVKYRRVMPQHTYFFIFTQSYICCSGTALPSTLLHTFPDTLVSGRALCISVLGDIRSKLLNFQLPMNFLAALWNIRTARCP